MFASRILQIVIVRRDKHSASVTVKVRRAPEAGRRIFGVGLADFLTLRGVACFRLLLRRPVHGARLETQHIHMKTQVSALGFFIFDNRGKLLLPPWRTN